jgi:hypothetical protein
MNILERIGSVSPLFLRRSMGTMRKGTVALSLSRRESEHDRLDAPLVR